MLSFDERMRNPKWVYEKITKNDLEGDADRKDCDFKVIFKFLFTENSFFRVIKKFIDISARKIWTTEALASTEDIWLLLRIIEKVQTSFKRRFSSQTSVHSILDSTENSGNRWKFTPDH